MANNVQKVHLVRSQNATAVKKAADAIQVLGKALPASVVSRVGSIVTVKFEIQSGFTLPNVTCPLAGAEYIRYPLQPGCKGVVFPSDAPIGAMSGLSASVAKLVSPANLAALTFFPIGNAGWEIDDDPNALVVYGEDGGVVLRTKDGQTSIKITDGSIVIADSYGNNISMGSAGISMMASSGVTINGVLIDENQNVTATGEVTAGGFATG